MELQASVSAPALLPPPTAAPPAQDAAIRDAWARLEDLDDARDAWEAWRDAALARAGLRFDTDAAPEPPAFVLAAVAALKVDDDDADRRWALTWRLAASAAARAPPPGPTFVCYVGERDAPPALATAAGPAWSGFAFGLDAAHAPALAGPAAAGLARALRGGADDAADFYELRDALAVCVVRARSGGVFAAARVVENMLAGVSRALRLRVDAVAAAKTKALRARPWLPGPADDDDDLTSPVALALFLVAAVAAGLPAAALRWSEETTRDVAFWVADRRRPELRLLALEAGGALAALQCRGEARPVPCVAAGLLDVAARALRDGSGAGETLCAVCACAGLLPGAHDAAAGDAARAEYRRVEDAVVDAVEPFVRTWLALATNCLAGEAPDAAGAAAIVGDARAAAAGMAVLEHAVHGSRGAFWRPRVPALMREALDYLAAASPDALDAAPAGLQDALYDGAPPACRLLGPYVATEKGREVVPDDDAPLLAVLANLDVAELAGSERRAFRFALAGPARRVVPWADAADQARADEAWAAAYEALLAATLARPDKGDDDVEILAHHLETELRDEDNAAAFACVLGLADEALLRRVVATLDDGDRVRVEALVAGTLARAAPDDDATPGERRAMDHFERTGELVPPELLPDAPPRDGGDENRDANGRPPSRPGSRPRGRDAADAPRPPSRPGSRGPDRDAPRPPSRPRSRPPATAS